MRINVDVTEDDIKHGRANDVCDCPVARAVRRVLPETSVRVNCDGFLGTSKGYAQLPKEVEDRIAALDCFGIMQPFSFALELHG